jgi:hypothetical protein
LRAEKFRPFAVKLKAGKTLYVRDRDYAWVPPLSGTVHVIDCMDRLYILSPREIDYIETDEKAIENSE